MKLDSVVCGGTFDHFHKGHTSLLSLAFSLGSKVTIGVTSDGYVKNSKSRIKNSELIESYEERKNAIEFFLKKENVFNRAKILKIDDLFGPTLDKDILIQAIIVSQNTRHGAEIINKERQKRGLSKLEIFVSPMVFAQDGKEISSSRIRNGEINRQGKLYINSSLISKKLVITKAVRKSLKKPLGILFKNLDNLNIPPNAPITVVGDVTCEVFNHLAVNQDISVLDFLVNREKKFTEIKELGFSGGEKIINVDNPAGSITSDLFKAVKKAVDLQDKQKVIIRVDGEEDLAVLPLVLALPLNSYVFYGQPNEGIVSIEVNEKNKEKILRIVNGFSLG